ncbi:MAG TPA: ABC transporter substrate-binding protein [Sphaerochaeta sp.]|nr:ABC transporter substrate-binding protein [Sphaerochaeta sp.]
MKKLALVFALVALTMTMVFASGAPEAATAEKEVEIKFVTWWTGEDTKGPYVKQIVDDFNAAHAGKIHVTLEGTNDADGIFTQIMTQLGAGNPPDVFSVKPQAEFYGYYDSDLLMDFAEDLKGAWGDQFAEGIVASTTIDGATKSLPYEMAYVPIWYNMDILNAVGISKVPETMDEFWAMCEATKAAGYYPTAQMTGGTNAWFSMLWYTSICGSIGGAGAFDNIKEDWATNPVYVQAAEILCKMVREYTTPDVIGATAPVANSHFKGGETAVYLNGPWWIARLDDARQATTEFAFFPAINYKDVLIGSVQSNLAAANTKDAAKRAAIVEFLKYFTTAQNAQLVSNSGAVLACKYEPLENSSKLAKDLQARINEASGFIPYWENCIGTADVVAEFGQALSAMIQGAITPEQFVAQIASVM